MFCRGHLREGALSIMYRLIRYNRAKLMTVKTVVRIISPGDG